MRRRCYVLLKCPHDVPIRCCGDEPLRRLGDVPLRRHWVFHLRRSCDVAGTHRETFLRRRHNVLLPGGSSVHIDNKGKDMLILGKGPTQGLNNTTLTAEIQCSINFTRPGVMFCLSLHYNGNNSFLFVNATKKYQIEAKDSEIEKYPFCLGNISGDFSANNMKKCVRFFR